MTIDISVLILVVLASGYLTTVAAAQTNPPAPPSREELLAGAENRIKRIRMAEVALRLEDEKGTALPAGTEIRLEQTRHAFLFGGILNPLLREMAFNERPFSEEHALLFRKRFMELFNFGTIPFYWKRYEPEAGNTKEASRKELARWCRENGIRAKGHVLLWTHEPAWVTAMPGREGVETLFKRVERDTAAFRGLLDVWDVVNEPCCGIQQGRDRKAEAVVRAYETMGLTEVLKRAFSAARRSDPEAQLLLNDWDTRPEFESLVEQSLAAGAMIDGIGIQSHMHEGYWGTEKVWDVCERFGRFGKPVHFTEVTLISGPDKASHSTTEGERQQAKDAAEMYTVLFSHPSVEAITWWDLTDRGAWMNAPAGLLRIDMSPKPAYEELKQLIKGAWWTQAEAQVDADGKARIRGFLGAYRVTALVADTELAGEFNLSRTEDEVQVVVRRTEEERCR